MEHDLKNNVTSRAYWIVFPVLFIFYAWIYPEQGFSGDIYCWKEWAKFNVHHGLGHAYNSDSNYLPVYHYVLYLFGKLIGNDALIDEKIHYLKLVSFFFDVITCIFMLDLLKKKLVTTGQQLGATLLLLLNPAFVYNSLVWGQVDGMMTCFVFISFCLALKEKILLSLIFFVIAINFKLQAIIFAPLILLTLFPTMKSNFSFRKLFMWLISIAAFEILIILPFILEDTHKSIWKVVVHSFDHYPFISMNAFNFWYLFYDTDLTQVSDTTFYYFLSLKHWGTLAFFLGSLIILFPVLYFYIKGIASNMRLKIQPEYFILAGSLIPLLFFYFNTQMHERYAHPCIIFLTTYALYSRNYSAWLLASIAYFLNLESVLGYYSHGFIREFHYQKQIISCLFGISILLIYKDYFTLLKRDFFEKRQHSFERQ